jgi:hypothetical protein
MKNLLLILTFLLVASSVTFAADGAKMEVKKETKKKPLQEQNATQKFIFHLNELKFVEDCCDGTSRTTYIVYDDNNPLESIYIPDPRGDCPNCPPE